MNPLLFSNIGAPGVIILLLGALLPIYCIFNIAWSDFKEGNSKMLWILIVIFVPWGRLSISYLEDLRK